MTRLLVTGASGMVGSNLLHTLARRFAISGTYHRNPYHPPGIEMYEVDLARLGSISAALRAARPDVIVHAAARTGLDWCESHPEETRAANVDGTRNVAEIARGLGAKVVLISTDSVFDGTSPPYREDDPTGPVNVYARSKIDSEPFVLALPAGLVVRTTLFGWNVQPRPDAAARTVERLERSEEVTGFRDWISSPILANDLADVLGEMIERGLEGVYHVCGRDSVSKLEFSRRVAAAFGLDESLVRSGDSADVVLPAKRPRDTTLDVSKVERALGRAMPGLTAGLERFRRLRDEGYVATLRRGAGSAVPSAP